MKRADLQLQLGDQCVLFNGGEHQVRKIEINAADPFPVQIGYGWYTRNGLFCIGDSDPEFTVMKVNGVEIIDEIDG